MDSYEKPEVVEQSVEEMLAEAQAAIDSVFERLRKFEANFADLETVAMALRDEAEGLATQLTDAERLVQRVTYVAEVKGEQDAATDGR